MGRGHGARGGVRGHGGLARRRAARAARRPARRRPRRIGGDHLPVARHQLPEAEHLERLGLLQLPGPRVPTCVPRVRGHRRHHGGRRGPAGVRPGHVGVREGARPVRDPDGTDAAAVLHRRLHRLDGGALLRGLVDHPVPLPQPVGALDRTVTCPARPSLRGVQHRSRCVTPATAGREVLHGHVGAGDRRGAHRAPAHRGCCVRLTRHRRRGPAQLGGLRGRRLGDRCSAGVPAGGRRRRRRPRRRLGLRGAPGGRRGAGPSAEATGPRGGVVPRSGALGRPAGHLGPRRLGPGSRYRSEPAPAGPPARRGLGRERRDRRDLVPCRPGGGPGAGQGLVLPQLAGGGCRGPLPGGTQPDGGDPDR